jgi:carbamoyl-phosphate synthase large subunit
MKEKLRVLVAGIGGASLGTEILKSLILAENYEVFGCDISPLAFGHYHQGITGTFLADPANYVDSIVNICSQSSIQYVIPGAEEPMVLLNSSLDRLVARGIKLASNNPEIIRIFSDKLQTFSFLSERGFAVPLTKKVDKLADLEGITFPCIVKPSEGSGGSSYVYFAEDEDEGMLYVQHLVRNGKKAIVQEYIPHDEGEFTVGVLSLPNGELFGSIALRRVFHNKLSLSWKGKGGLISSGYSQGLIDDFPDVCRTAEEVANSVQSRGPLNIQGRVKDKVFYPFEINPRFSASTYLRSLAGFNEVDIYLRVLAGESFEEPLKIRPGYYLRSFTETFFSEPVRNV